MATITRTTFVDDIDGSEKNVETVQFSVDRRAYEIDLSKSNAKKLRKALDPFIERAHPVTTGRRRSKSSTQAQMGASRDQLRAIRTWARENGYTVADRGRVSQQVKDAFEAAH